MSCQAAGSGRAALRLFYSTHPDLVLLDLALPEMDGWQVCERIREVSQVPIIMLTARGEEAAKVRGLQMGADDYVTKPFGFPELLARVQAVLRRAAAGEQAHDVYRQGDLLLDPQAHRASLAGADLELTPTEYRLLAFLMQHSGQLLTHRQILAGRLGAGLCWTTSTRCASTSATCAASWRPTAARAISRPSTAWAIAS